MSTSFERHDERDEDRYEDRYDEISSRRPPEPEVDPTDPWETLRLDRSAPNGADPTRPIGADESRFGPPPRELSPRPSRSTAHDSFRRPDADAGQPQADPWLQPQADPWIDVTPGTQTSPSPALSSRGHRGGLAIGLFVGGAVIGALLVGLYTGWGSNASSALTRQSGAAQNGPVQPGAQGGQGQPGLDGQGGQGFGGGVNGEQHIFGTLTGVTGSKLSVKSGRGTATYTIASDTQIIRDGQLASASDLRVGDAVLVHVFPAANSDGVLERVIARSGSTTSRPSTGTLSPGEDGTTT